MSTIDITTDFRLPKPTRERWQFLRAGIQNLWEYDDQRFSFHGGRLLLRGRNESGKTKALEVLLPFLLDADLAPQRLDPFGSMSRPMRWNLVSDQNPDVTVNIGYVWLELGRRNGDAVEYCTVGAGMRAKRTTPGVDVWYFVTELRVDEQLRLMDERRDPLALGKLVTALGGNGEVFETKEKYRRELNKRLFAIPEDQYAALVDTLLQLRRPQLSKSLDPDELSRILTASLPALEPRMIAPLAEGFERLDRHRNERDALARAAGEIQQFVGEYRSYATIICKACAQDLTRGDSAYQKRRSDQKVQAEAHEVAVKAEANFKAQVDKLDAECLRLDETLRTLRASDEYRSVTELERAQQAARDQAGLASRAASHAERAKAERDKASSDRTIQENLASTQRQAVAAMRTAAATAATAAMLDPLHTALDASLSERDWQAARGTTDSVVRSRREAMGKLSRLVRDVERAQTHEDNALALVSDRETNAVDAQALVMDAEAHERTAREEHNTALTDWLEDATILQIADGDRIRALDAPAEQSRSVIAPAEATASNLITAEEATIAGQLHAVRQRQDKAIAERDSLLTTPHCLPPAQPWHAPRPDDRPGAPLYLLVEFARGDADVQAGVESALEASGLLDAWVTPEGQVLDPRTFDTVFTPSLIDGPTLADVLRPTPAGGVDVATIDRVLRTVELGSDRTSTCSVSPDGQWRVGPLSGAWRKPAAEYVGATARAETRARRLQELDAELTRLQSESDALELRQLELRAQRDRLRAELAAFPSVDAILLAKGRVEAAAIQLRTARAALDEAKRQHVAAMETLRLAERKRDVEAAECGLSSWIDSLDELDSLTTTCERAALAWCNEVRHLVTIEQALATATATAAAATERASELQREFDEANRNATTAKTRADTLRDALGNTPQTILRNIAESDTRLTSARQEHKQAHEDLTEAVRHVGETSTAVAAAERAVADADQVRRLADDRFRRLAQTEFPAIVGFTGPAEPTTWSFTESLRTARELDTHIGTLDWSQPARDGAENRVNEAYQTLARTLPSDMKVFADRVDSELFYRCAWNGRPRALLELVSELDAVIASHDQLLGDEERKLFETFLAGEAHEHLRARIRQANALVDEMNAQLEHVATASGMRIRLKWKVSPEAPAGTTEAIDLLLRSSHLLSDSDRAALRQFLQQRLTEARREDSTGTLQERMVRVLDYRAWFAFQAESSTTAGTWNALTKKVHGAGSGGQKAVMLHLPLFAAAAAFYRSASTAAPRVIVLDEAFAGIDRETRAQLMQLLVAFDLDFIMTSHEEWGFYRQLDALSTYHLRREPGMRGVFAEWFIWNGHEAKQLHN